MLKNKDIVIISPQRWGGMWVSKHWIAYELSKANRVLFVGPSIWLGGALREPVGSEIFKKLFREHKVQVKENLFIFSPILYLNILPKLGLSQKVTNDPVIQLQSEVNRLGFKNIVLLNFDTRPQVIDCLSKNLSIAAYYCVDPPFPKPGEENDELITCQKSDIIFAVSELYKNKLKSMIPEKEIVILPHGYDVDTATKVMNDDSVSVPVELCKLNRPIIGYVGSLHDMTIDIELIEEISRSRPKWNYVLIGPYKNNPIGNSMHHDTLSRLKKLKNIYLFGPKHYNQLPHYIKYFDVGMVLINNKLNDSLLTKQRTSFKLLQYLAQGKPIVSPPMDDLYRVKDLIYIGDSPGQYLKGIEAAISENKNADLQDLRINYARQFSYAKILELMSFYLQRIS